LGSAAEAPARKAARRADATPEQTAARLAARKLKAEADREKIMARLLKITLDEKRQVMARVNAADKWLDRHEGKAPQVTVRHDGGAKTLEELICESMKPEDEAT
jgi:hypothetical protein